MPDDSRVIISIAEVSDETDVVESYDPVTPEQVEQVKAILGEPTYRSMYGGEAKRLAMDAFEHGLHICDHDEDI